jgi:hypothetical protein
MNSGAGMNQRTETMLNTAMNSADRSAVLMALVNIPTGCGNEDNSGLARAISGMDGRLFSLVITI